MFKERCKDTVNLSKNKDFRVLYIKYYILYII